MEQTFVMIKPDGVQRGLVGEIIKRYEKKGLKIKALKMIKVSEELAASHYQEHQGKPFYQGLIEYITSGPVVALVVEGKNAVEEVRKINGATDPLKAQCGTIRGDFAQSIGRNVVHGSDSVESGKREIDIYFTSQEIIDYSHPLASWLDE